jgi:arylsulfatase A-like enzyme
MDRQHISRRTAGFLASSLMVCLAAATSLVPVGPTAQAVADGTGRPAPAISPRAGARPNILLITTDDMALEDLRHMPITRRLLGNRGVTFDNFIAPHPMCCPSRAQILTGEYAQNNGVHHNEGPWGGYQALIHPNNTLAAWLSAAGYKTALVGKFLNHWKPGSDGRPAGWTHLEVLMTPFQPYGFAVWRNGVAEHPAGHTSDYVAHRTVDLINRFSRQRRPFFIWASQVAPHMMWGKHAMVPPIPPPRHRGLFASAVAPSLVKASFREADVSDKPAYVRDSTENLTEDGINEWYRRRMQSLQAVDEGVASAVTALRRRGELDNTVIAFTSDNGYLLGEHRLVKKNYPYEEALRVPFLMRGPGLPPGRRVTGPAQMIDVAATFASLAGATPRRAQDGESLLGLVKGTSPLRNAELIQAGTEEAPWWWRGVRTSRYTYVHYETDGFVELYDRERDPLQLQNVAGQPDYAGVEVALRAELQRLQDCSGASCR